MIPEHVGALRFDWDDSKHRYSFYIDRETPKILAAHVAEPVKKLLDRHGLRQKDIRHWIAHTGGAAILDGIEKSLGLDPAAFRHTRSVLRDYGNLSSGSFLFSFERLLAEAGSADRSGPGAGPGHGVMMTMGPGLTIELALVEILE